jgi:uncharacterized protein DUF6701
VWTGSWSGGAYNFSATKFTRSSSPDGPYDVLDIGVVISDETSLAAAARPYLVSRNMDETNASCTADSAGTSDGTCTAIKLAANAKERYGRLRLSNAFGSQKSDLAMPVQAQYWGGNSWVLNSADGCTSLLASAFNLVGAPTGTSASAVTIASGAGTLTLTKPSPTATGGVDVAANLGSSGSDQSCLSSHGGTAAALPWLRSQNGNCAATYDRDPSARATFGIYTPETRKTVHVREQF